MRETSYKKKLQRGISAIKPQKFTSAKMALANEVYEALSNNRLKLAYQPIIEAKSGKLHSYECLHANYQMKMESLILPEVLSRLRKKWASSRISICMCLIWMVIDRLEKDKDSKTFHSICLTFPSAMQPGRKRFFERAKPANCQTPDR